jgi:hypothetical protein
MLLRDLVRGGEPVRVAEKRGSAGLRQWNRIATQVVTLRDRAVISGTLMVFDHAAGEALLARLRKSSRALVQAAPAITNASLDAALGWRRDATGRSWSTARPIRSCSTCCASRCARGHRRTHPRGAGRHPGARQATAFTHLALAWEV